MKQLILASQSPRRRELLEKCEIPFICIPADIDETMDLMNDPAEEVKILSHRKAEHILKLHPDAVVIGSDTIVAIDGKVLGKPQSHEEAAEMLRALSGHTHQVITGLSVLSNEKEYLDVSVSDVTFAEMSEEEVQAYIATGECDDKAGAYGIQGFGGRYITGIHGDYYAIMGLPLQMVYAALKQFY